MPCAIKLTFTLRTHWSRSRRTSALEPLVSNTPRIAGDIGVLELLNPMNRGKKMKNSIVAILVAGFLLTAYTQAILAYDVSLIGADPGSNSTGEITTWVGSKGLTCPAGYENGDFLPNPYKGEKPLFRIDQSNLAKYESRLSPGQIARLKRNKNFYLNVYPTHRNYQFPKFHTDATKKNLKTTKIGKNSSLQDFNGGIPFPVPKNGVQAAWNIKMQFIGDDVITTHVRRVVSPSGRIRRDIQVTKALYLDENRLESRIENPDKMSKKVISYYTYPADKDGTGTLIFNHLDDSRGDTVWLYIPALRRVRRAPTMGAGAQVDGESTMDEMQYFFRGSVDDWNWKLLGKKEMYISVNTFDMFKVGTPDKEECLPGDINPKILRYELRRVWAVEATAKEGINHPYGKRVFYADEDNWYATAADHYGKRANLWRFSEFNTYQDYCQERRMMVGMMYLNLESGRYEFYGGGYTEKTKASMFNQGFKNSDFTVQSLRRVGR